MASDRRLPPQGGLPPTDGARSGALEIACDESGFSGTNLLDPSTPIVTHASTDLTVAEAGALIAALGSGFRWSVDELKSGQFLRSPDASAVVDWFLESLDGRAHVQVVDKEFFLVTRIVDLFLFEPTWTAGTSLSSEQREPALALYRAGRDVGPDWGDFLSTFAEMVRTKRRQHPDRRAIGAFFAARDTLRSSELGSGAEAVLDALGRSRVQAVVTRLVHGDRSVPPPLEPLLPALAETVLFWSAGGRQVLVVHDEQSALTAARLTRLQQSLADAAGTFAEGAGRSVPPVRHSPLAGLVSVDSRDDARVQVADLLAGIARRARSAHEVDRLQPFLSASSLHDPLRTPTHP